MSKEINEKGNPFPGADKSQESYLIREVPGDEIDLGILLRKIGSEWKIVTAIVFAGIISSLAIALSRPSIYEVETILHAPSISELGDLLDQNLIEIKPTSALRQVIDQILAPELQKRTLENSNLFKPLMQETDVPANEMVNSINHNLKVVRIQHEYYELGKEEKTPLKEINVSIESSTPVLTAEFIHQLVTNAQKEALDNISEDARRLKAKQLGEIRRQLESLSLAAKGSREAEIVRLQEANREKAALTQQQIELKVRKAVKDRENEIIRLAEALETANALDIREPVAWDDLRPLRESRQITNDLGGKDVWEPLYFRGSRLLKAELDRLQGRKDDRPFVTGLTELDSQMIQLKNDPRIDALRSRDNDTIYIDKFDEMQRKINDLLDQPTEFPNAQMAVVSQPAAVPASPTNRPMLIILVGVVLSGFLALTVAMVRISLRNTNSDQ
jgi:LPS O-antigen subunit length determinant protein (WzzB/FepE family)